MRIKDGTYDCQDFDGWKYGLYLDPETEEVSFWSMHGEGTPPSVWHRRAVIIRLPTGAVGKDVRRIVIEGIEFRELVSVLFDLYEGSSWDGSNFVGEWSDGMADVLRDLEDLFAEVPLYCKAADWLEITWKRYTADEVRGLLAEGDSLQSVAKSWVDEAAEHETVIDEHDMVLTLEDLLEDFPQE